MSTNATFNLLGESVIAGIPEHKGVLYSERFKNTPAYPDVDVDPGVTLHIGGGVFRSACAGGCGAYADNHGGGYWIPLLRRHEADEHGLQVLGVNVGLLED